MCVSIFTFGMVNCESSILSPSTMTKDEKDKLIAKALMSDQGRELLRPIIQGAGAEFADMCEPGSLGEHLGRAVAGRPPKLDKK